MSADFEDFDSNSFHDPITGIDSLIGKKGIGHCSTRKYAADAVAFIQNLAPEDQTTVLSTPGGVYGLAVNYQATQTLNLIGTLSADQQTKVLSSTNAVKGLVEFGFGNEVIALIAALSPEQQTTILTAPYHTVATLGHRGHVEKTFALIQRLLSEQQTWILSVPHAVYNLVATLGVPMGEKLAEEMPSRMLELIAALSPDQQTAILSEPSVLHSFTRASCKKPLIDLLDSLPEKNRATLSAIAEVKSAIEHIKLIEELEEGNRQPNARIQCQRPEHVPTGAPLLTKEA